MCQMPHTRYGDDGEIVERGPSMAGPRKDKELLYDLQRRFKHPWWDHPYPCLAGYRSGRSFKLDQVFEVWFAYAQPDKMAFDTWKRQRNESFPDVQIFHQLLDIPAYSASTGIVTHKMYCIVYIPKSKAIDGRAALKFAIDTVLPEYINKRLHIGASGHPVPPEILASYKKVHPRLFEFVDEELWKQS